VFSGWRYTRCCLKRPGAAWCEGSIRPNSEALWRGNPHDELSHAEEESRPRDHIAADFRTSEESSGQSMLLPLPPLTRRNETDCRADTRPRLSVWPSSFRRHCISKRRPLSEHPIGDHGEPSLNNTSDRLRDSRAEPTDPRRSIDQRGRDYIRASRRSSPRL